MPGARAARQPLPRDRGPGAPEPIVKPVETVSAMDLLMQDVEERQAGSDDSDA